MDRATALRGLVDKAAVALDGAPAQEILRWADEQLEGRLVVATSMQDAVVVSLAASVRPGIDVVFLDTGYHFPETIGMRDAVAATYDIRLLSVQPALSVGEQDAAYGMYDGWVTGLRRTEAATRVGVQPIEWDGKREMLKVNPIVAWSDADVEGYIEAHGILVNPLRSEGFLSIGCAPCTRQVAPGEDPRAGRWAGTDKKECGLHL
jgi:phosphoadenosine phosphosulfate reductase